MRSFYAFWFFFSAGWGYLLAGPSEFGVPQWGQLLASFPLSFLTCFVLIALELRRLPSGQLAHPPSLGLKPWNRPAGLFLFIALTFVFAAFWGVAFAVALPLPGLRSALHFLGLGMGALTALVASRYVFRSKFGT
jgi:hypothetical protein